MSKEIAFLSASDRNNYGDLLFPMVFNEYLKKEFPDYTLKNYGMVNSDLSDYGALETESYKDLEALSQRNQDLRLVIGGGEVLFPRWTLLYSYINPTFGWLFKKSKFFKKLEYKLEFSKKLLSSTNQAFPFTPFFDGVKCFYNSVGGVDISKLNESEKSIVKKNLDAASLVSVRDELTQESLESIGINGIKLIPDSAIVMSDFYPVEKLEKLSFPNVEQLPEKYVMLQLGSRFEPSDLELFIDGLKNYATNHGCKVVCCPIGLASGHEDDKILKKICEIEQSFIYIHPENLFDIMYVIAKAQVYFGTSLHGLITSLSFLTKFVPLNKGVHKMSRYANTWASKLGTTKCYEYTGDWDEIEQLTSNWDFDTHQKLLDEQKALVFENFEKFVKG